MSSQAARARRFLELHVPGSPLLMPNPWDAGSARLLASLGFEALATTSSGFAATLGRLDGDVTRAEAIAHAATVVAATELPVSADLEDCFASSAGGVGATLRLALEAGLAGCSIEDYSDGEVLDLSLAAARVAEAAEVAHAGSVPFVLTARAENHLYDAGDLDDTIARLRAYEEAGADVLYAPGLRSVSEVRAVVSAVSRPVNVLALPGMPSVAELAGAGVARISTGGAFAFAGLGAVVEAARELRDGGTYGYWPRSQVGSKAAKKAFS
jgi:2-methylisocitrate lyase-like PEP mutase family enzyme